MHKVIIMVDTARASGRKFLRGIERYISSNADWEVCIQPPHYLPGTHFNPTSWFKLQEADGLIDRDSNCADAFVHLQIPKIISDTKLENPGVSTIYTNSEKTGRIAAEYFLELGFKHFAYCGFEGLAWSERRFRSFAGVLKKNGFSCVYHYHDWLANAGSSETEDSRLAQWLTTLPKPVCVFACNDDRGVNVLEACKIAGLTVPEEVAVLGVDNDDLLCDLSSPPLSSIELNFERGGFEAAKLLDQMMTRGMAHTNIVIEPVDIVTRQSTTILAIDDPEVVKALVFIREHYEEPIQVKDVVAATVISRRDLEMKFKNKLRRSIKEEIDRLRIKSVQRKLANTSDTIHNIAASLSYTDPQHFSRFFRKAAGISPSAYRRLNKPYM
ncbi:MAG TPA: DNA-binding transcriptional regulator [Anaerohalosphaeraceae bacterium]|nr:DNA-binding transcriptional regulator [Phycisphaerae bacterium]HOL31244.1 DNA-binding transcriptional regulator [Anaerohalosphaeraceae bacterium]HOM75027.1 DNA-binding transcriptional regulator [Anaerohalosphaeraceae bacterium]HPC63635.1 DNA-binding transcriptional regulator [Anaerohalosphaeraceae bacterium]HPO68890.1 DNA-binding transcriptional regulator [Anaerohalosphaeraceae bacterium]